MFHYKQISSLGAALTAVMAVIFVTFTAPGVHAAVVPTTDLSTAKTQKLSASLKDITGKDELILDHATGKAEFTFDIPAGDYASDIRLKIRALPQGNIDGNATIMVRFNSGKPVPINSRGNGFSAEIALSGARVRSQNNTVSLTYTGAEAGICSDKNHGKWVIDLESSRISADVRSKGAGYQIAHIEPRLAHPMTAPRTVAIIAKGDDKAALEALAAQAIGLRVKDIPTFKLRDSHADLKIYVGTRAQLGRLIKSSEIIADENPVIGIQSVSRRPQIIITADNQADLKALVQSFAYAHLPRSRRARVSLSQMSVQMPFSYETATPVKGRRSWTDLGASNFSSGLNPAPEKLTFKVQNAQMSTGELRLGLSKSSDIADGSRVSVALNGAPLGYTKMDKISKIVAFPFPAGSLLSGKNVITVTPDLIAGEACTAASLLPPQLLVTTNSALLIETPESGLLDLGSFAAAGAPFSDAAAGLTDVYFTGGEADRAAALKILAKAAQTSGEGWTAARFLTRAPESLDSSRNALVLGPLPTSKLAMLSGAPRAFQDAMRGRLPVPAAQTARAKVAGANADQAFALAARKINTAPRTGAAGIAAVYAGQKSGSAIGVISTPRPRDFAGLANALVQDPNWSNLSGGVARWDRTAVTLLQTADSRLIARPGARSGNNIAQVVGDFNAAARDRFASTLSALVAMKPALKSSESTLQAKTQVRPMAPVLRQQKTAPAPIITKAVYRPAVLRGRTSPAIAAPAISASSNKNTLAQWLDWSTFSPAYFKANVETKTKALLGKTPAVKISAMPQAKTGTDFKQGITAMLSGDFTSKGLLILLVALMALMLLGLAAPSSSNKKIG